MAEKEIWGPGARFFLIAAGFVVVVAGVKAAAPILLPFSLALFLAVLSLPILFSLQGRGLPTPAAIFVTVLVDLAVLAIIVLLVTQSMADFQERLPQYVRRFQNLYAAWIDNLQNRGLPVGEFLSTEFFSVSAVLDFAGGTLTRLASLLSSTFLVFLILVFILAEASVFPKKFRAVLGKEDLDLGRFTKITGEIQDYLVIKTVVSLATGSSIGLWAWITGLDFPILLGLIGFAFNYVPTIGSILAAIPAMLLALIQTGSIGLVSVVAVGYVGINVIFGNLIEPQLLGRRLGISTLVVILSLLFWAWVWGPVGALLAVPLTMVVKIGLENTEDLRWVALLIDKEAPQAAGGGGGVPGPAARDVPGPAASDVPEEVGP